MAAVTQVRILVTAWTIFFLGMESLCGNDHSISLLSKIHRRAVWCGYLSFAFQKNIRNKNAVTRIRTWVTAATTQGPNH